MKKIKQFITGFMFFIGLMCQSQVITISCNDNLEDLFIGDTISMSGEEFYISCDGTIQFPDVNDSNKVVNGCGSNTTIYIYVSNTGCNSDWTPVNMFYKKQFNLFLPTSIKEPETLDFGIYPNPTSDFVTVQVKNRSNFDVFSMSGQLMMTSMLNPGSNSIDLTNLPTGVYSTRINGVTKQLIRL